jgi:hypothetical protein
METESVSHLDSKYQTDKFHILNENIPYQAEITLIFFKSYTVKVNNNTYIRCHFKSFGYFDQEMGFETGIETSQFYQSTYAGIDSEISVVVGQEVKKRQFNYSGSDENGK